MVNIDIKNEPITINHSGLTCKYLRPYPVEAEIPSLGVLSNNPRHNFVTGFSGNHFGLTWITLQKVNSENYKSFLYSFILHCQDAEFSPSNGDLWQYKKNLRKFVSKLKHKHIAVTAMESQMIHFLSNIEKHNKMVRFQQLGLYCHVLESTLETPRDVYL